MRQAQSLWLMREAGYCSSLSVHRCRCREDVRSPSLLLPRFSPSGLMRIPSDVQSLHNRLQIVESQIAQIYAGGIRVPTVLAGVSSDNFPFSHNDRTILAVGCSGSSVTVPLDDVAALWLEYLDLPRSCPAEVNASCTSASSSSSTPMNLEPYTS